MLSQQELLDRIKATLSTKPAWVSGTISVPSECGALYFEAPSGGSPQRIDLLAPAPDALAQLVGACDPATFGLNRADVLDETYRKALKLDADRFATNFGDALPRVLAAVERELVADLEPRRIRAERYKLNVYNEGAFFKPHQDTPRGEQMFGSLVIVFPTAHEGGALVLRHAGREFTLDSAQAITHAPGAGTDDNALADAPTAAGSGRGLLDDLRAIAESSNSRGERNEALAAIAEVEASSAPAATDAAAAVNGPRIAYAAFFSDVEHEVLPVTSGHRVTLTYNLYWERDTAGAATSASYAAAADTLLAQLRALLGAPDFLPNGGRLAFGLTHQYPVPARGGALSLLRVQHGLKGADTLLARALTALGLAVRPHALYDDEGTRWLCDRLVDFGDYEIESVTNTLHHEGGLLVQKGPKYERYYERLKQQLAEITWVTPASQKVSQHFIAYGNQAMLADIYAELCLVARIGAPGSRDVIPADEPPTKDDANKWASDPYSES